MQEGEDTWRDVEMTGYVYVTSSTDEDLTWYCRGGRHSDSVNKCEGVAYKGSLSYNSGEVRVRKEQWHSSGYVSQPWREGTGGSIRNKWVGHKFMCYNVGTKPNINVKLEIWVDRNNDNNWIKVYDYTDTGNWGDGNHCSGVRNQKLTWSAPHATFRWDTTGVRFKKFSVREIAPTGGASPPPGPPGPSPPPPPPGPTPPPPGSDLGERFVYPNEAVTASSSAPSNPVSNLNDQILNTLWATQPLPAWVKVDLLTTKKVMYTRTGWAAHATIAQVISYNIETSLDNVTYVRHHDSTATVPAGAAIMTNSDVVDHNARFVRINIVSNSAADLVGIYEFEVWGDPTPIGGEPPAPSPPPGIPPPPGVPPPPPIQGDPNYVYAESRHVFHVNYQSSTQPDTDLCAPVIPVEGTGPSEIEGPDIIITETIPPLVINTIPTHDTLNVAVDTTILIEMTEAMDLTTINSSTVVMTPSVDANYTLGGEDNHIINIDPLSDLANSTSYTVTVKGGVSGVKDLVGNALPSDHVFSFSTASAVDTVAPTIVTKTPDSGATNVSRTTNITITFSEPMLQSRVTNTEIDLRQTSNNTDIPVTITLSGDGMTATVNPNSDLAGSTQYTVRVRGGAAPSVADTSGNAMADPDVEWSFTTVAPVYTLIYDLSAHGSSWTQLDSDPYDGVGLRLDSTSTSGTVTNNPPLINKKPKKVEVFMYRDAGLTTGTTKVRLYRYNTSSTAMTMIAEIGTMNNVDITTSSAGVWYAFENGILNHPMEVNDCIIVVVSDATTSNKLYVRRTDSNVWDKGILMRKEDGSNEPSTDTGRDWPHKIYE